MKERKGRVTCSKRPQTEHNPGCFGMTLYTYSGSSTLPINVLGAPLFIFQKMHFIIDPLSDSTGQTMHQSSINYTIYTEC